MDESVLNTLEYDEIKRRLAELCVSNLGKRLVSRLTPYTDRTKIETELSVTGEAVEIVKTGAQPLPALHDVTEAIEVARRGGIIVPRDLLKIADVLRGGSKFKRFMRGKAQVAPHLAGYAESIADLDGLRETLEVSIDGERVSDRADDELRRVRRAIASLEGKIQSKLSSILNSAALRDAVQDSYVTQKNGRFVIPVRASLKHKVPGSVIAASSTGMTVFIEPSSIRPLVDELVTQKALEEEIVYRVLCALTEEVLNHSREININLETLAVADLALAKGRLSLEIGGVCPSISRRPVIDLKGARHPLLGKSAVPLDIRVGMGYRTLVITGPNTGGKTVLLKTVGLLCLMAQSGLHIPAEEPSCLPVFQHVFCDIGDNQSIQQSLSTFSSHMKNIARILVQAGPFSLVLLDEVGTGTDPREGASLAASVLDYLYAKGAITLATTHYGDLKTYSESHPGFQNGCMEFDEETLEPLYRLIIGQSGRSQGIVVAKRLGLPPEVIERAKVYMEYMGRAIHEDLPWEKPIPVSTVRDTVEPITEDEEESGEPVAPAAREETLLLGDSVYVNPLGDRGIVAAEPDEKGNMVVLVRGKKYRLHQKRVRLLVKREDLYPEDYDLNIVLLSKDDRRAIKEMSKRHTDKTRLIEPPTRK